MANPPFNVDEVDAGKIKSDVGRRLPFGLPGVNKKGKVSNGNYLWISYFYSYLNDTGRSGFVMSSQASSAGNDEAKVREALIKTGHVEAMIDIRGNFFYTRSVPCQLWFFNKAKPAQHQDKVLMIDARSVFRKVTRKIYDFTPEQLNNLTAIVWLYRGQTKRFIQLIQDYVKQTLTQAHNCTATFNEYWDAMDSLHTAMKPFLKSQSKKGTQAKPYAELLDALNEVKGCNVGFERAVKDAEDQWEKEDFADAPELLKFIETDQGLAGLAVQSRDLVKRVDQAFKLITRLIEFCEKKLTAKKNDLWNNTEINGGRKNSLKKQAEAARKKAVTQLKQVRYFYKQSHWLLLRFPEGKFCDVEGLVKLVCMEDLKANDWSLTPGRYVGVAQEEVDEDFDFEETMRNIHAELAGLNKEAGKLAAQIAKNFETLGAFEV